MPKNCSSRLGFALFVLVTLFVIGRNVYRRSQEASLLNAIYGKDQEAAVSLLARGVFADNPARLTELWDQALQHNETIVARTLLQRGILPPHSDGQPVLLNCSCAMPRNSSSAAGKRRGRERAIGQRRHSPVQLRTEPPPCPRPPAAGTRRGYQYPISNEHSRPGLAPVWMLSPFGWLLPMATFPC